MMPLKFRKPYWMTEDTFTSVMWFLMFLALAGALVALIIAWIGGY